MISYFKIWQYNNIKFINTKDRRYLNILEW